MQDTKQLSLRIAGIDFDTHASFLSVVTDAATFTAAGLTPHIDQFNVEPASHSNGPGWSASAAAALAPLNALVEQNPGGSQSDVVFTMRALVSTLTGLVAGLIPLLAGEIAIALLGALLAAGWAARSRTATALRTE
ncbi:hypothetical protein AB0N06_32885 [Streptomyces sp. NPDC051020]|uniref:hypothetical protein n=1 Tax=Streptomyces sp. NPDC051020 TaxID=3155409 RepID=UPI0034277092